MACWLGGSLLKLLLYGARSLKQEQERKLLNAYARGYKKYRQRQMERKRRKRERQPVHVYSFSVYTDLWAYPKDTDRGPQRE